jgi:hypothetical protein
MIMMKNKHLETNYQLKIKKEYDIKITLAIT